MTSKVKNVYYFAVLNRIIGKPYNGRIDKTKVITYEDGVVKYEESVSATGDYDSLLMVMNGETFIKVQS